MRSYERNKIPIKRLVKVITRTCTIECISFLLYFSTIVAWNQIKLGVFVASYSGSLSPSLRPSSSCFTLCILSPTAVQTERSPSHGVSRPAPLPAQTQLLVSSTPGGGGASGSHDFDRSSVTSLASLPEGMFAGEARHKDGSLLAIVFQVPHPPLPSLPLPSHLPPLPSPPLTPPSPHTPSPPLPSHPPSLPSPPLTPPPPPPQLKCLSLADGQALFCIWLSRDLDCERARNADLSMSMNHDPYRTEQVGRGTCMCMYM